MVCVVLRYAVLYNNGCRSCSWSVYHPLIVMKQFIRIILKLECLATMLLLFSEFTCFWLVRTFYLWSIWWNNIMKTHFTKRVCSGENQWYTCMQAFCHGELDAVLSCYVERMTRTGGHKTKACTGCWAICRIAGDCEALAGKSFSVTSDSAPPVLFSVTNK